MGLPPLLQMEDLIDMSKAARSFLSFFFFKTANLGSTMRSVDIDEAKCQSCQTHTSPLLVARQHPSLSKKHLSFWCCGPGRLQQSSFAVFFASVSETELHFHLKRSLLYLRLLPSSSNRYCTFSHWVEFWFGGDSNGTNVLQQKFTFLNHNVMIYILLFKSLGLVRVQIVGGIFFICLPRLHLFNQKYNLK